MSDIGRIMLEASTGIHGEVAQTIANEWAKVAGELERLSVTNILLEVVPGDGSGLEVYAKSVADVENKLSDMGSRLEDWELGIKRHPSQAGELSDEEFCAIQYCQRMLEQIEEARVLRSDESHLHDYRPATIRDASRIAKAALKRVNPVFNRLMRAAINAKGSPCT